MHKNCPKINGESETQPKFNPLPEDIFLAFIIHRNDGTAVRCVSVSGWVYYIECPSAMLDDESAS